MYEKIKKTVPWVCIAGGYLWAIWYHIFRGRLMLDSDISAEMVLSDLLNKEHSITGLSTGWIYSTGLRFLEMQWLFRFGLLLSPGDWHIARTIAMAIALALMVAAVCLIFYAIDRPDWGKWAAAMVIFPGGGWYFWQTIYGGQYTPYILISLFSTAFILLASKEPKTLRSRICIAALLILGAASGINGIKQLMVYHAPLCITALCVFLIELRKTGERGESLDTVIHSRRFRFAVLSWGADACAVAGYLVNKLILSGIYQFEQYESTVIDYKSFFEFVRLFIWSYGFAEGKALMSPVGIASMLGVVFGLIVALSAIVLVCRLRSLSEGDQMLTLLAVISILFCCFVFSYISGHGAIQYFQPVLPFGCFLVVIMVCNAVSVGEETKFPLMIGIMCVLLLTSMGTVHNEQDDPVHKVRAKSGLGPVVDLLVEQGYTQGVSFFWTSDVVTELSDGRIEMWTLSDESPDIMVSRLQKTEHLDHSPEGRYFYLFDVSDKESEFFEDKINVGLSYIAAHSEPAGLSVVYEDENYVVYGN